MSETTTTAGTGDNQKTIRDR